MSTIIKFIIILALAAGAIGTVVYIWQKRFNEGASLFKTPTSTQQDSKKTNFSTSANSSGTSTLPIGTSANLPASKKVTIMLPLSKDAYIRAMTKFTQEGGSDPLKTWAFVPKTLTVTTTSSTIWASANQAARYISPSGGPNQAGVVYLKVYRQTAYILLNIDVDSWAGASVSQAIIHPLVEKTLLLFPEIKKVVFDYATGDEPTR